MATASEASPPPALVYRPGDAMDAEALLRPNRGGDRQLNQALHTIVLTRSRTDPATRAYITRRRAVPAAADRAGLASGSSRPG